MAGFYPDPPAYRFAYDRDGTVVTNLNLAGNFNNLTGSTLRSINDETQAITSMTYRYVAFIFPENRNISHYFFSGNTGNANICTIESSTDTTNGQDGTWTSHTTTAPARGQVHPDFRSNIFAISITNVKAVRFSHAGLAGNYIYTIHWYGTVPLANSPDRLIVTDLSSAEITSQWDFADAARGTSQTKTFRVTNNSATQTANSIAVSFDPTSDASPSLTGQFQLSTDGVSYSNSINIGNLAPGASSGTLYLRNNVASNAALGLWATRVIASAGSWV